LVLSIEKIASSGVRTKEIPIGEADIPEAEFEIMDTVSASLRLDSVLSGVLKLSRKNTQDYIKSGRCSVNHRVTERNDYTLKVGDTLSLRGFGRYEVFFIGNITRSGRLHMQIKKYI
ncbi:MAG: hypothetical protein Q4B31_02745, partial [Clostridia bacterium]|nr:hypothetical protein [Clostridia bacterium]